jgi:rubrerythrin
MKDPTDMGMNRTGIKASPIDSQKTIDGAFDIEDPRLETPGDNAGLALERMKWNEEADPVGTMPLPGSVTGAVKTAVHMLKGKNANVFLDKLGERLAYERSGVRLYEALLAKLGAASVHAEGPKREELIRIRDEELEHFGMLREVIEALGGDATAMTPCADLTGVASSGILKVLTDPRSTLTQCLEMILIIELTDNEAWLTLADLAESFGQTEISERFRTALAQEEEHLARVRYWLDLRIKGQAGVEAEASPPPAP